MTETIVTVIMPSEAQNKTRQQWWADVLIGTFGAPNWKAIIADNVFALTSDVGTFILNNIGFASGMMCNKTTWENKYEKELRVILSSVAQNIEITSKQIEV